MTGERSCCYYNKFLWPDRYADGVPMEKVLELLKSEVVQALKYREIAGGAKNCCCPVLLLHKNDDTTDF